MKNMLKQFCCSLCLLVAVAAVYPAAAAPAEKTAAEAMVPELFRFLNEDLSYFTQPDAPLTVTVKEVSADVMKTIDSAYPVPEQWVYIERGPNATEYTVYLNKAVEAAGFSSSRHAGRFAEALAFSLGRALLAPSMDCYWKMREGRPGQPVYDGKQQVNPTFAVACYLAAACRSRLTGAPCTLHEYAREYAERDPRLKNAAEELAAHYPATLNELGSLLLYETCWVNARKEIEALMQGETKRVLGAMLPRLQAYEMQNALGEEPRDYIQKKYPYLAESESTVGESGPGYMLTRIQRYATQKRTLKVAGRMLEWQNREHFWGPNDLRVGTKEYEERRALHSELADLTCNELVPAMRIMCYLTAEMKDKESALKYKEAYLACAEHIDSLVAPLIQLGRDYYRDDGWCFDTLNVPSAFILLHETLLWVSYDDMKMAEKRLEWFGYDQTREFNERMRAASSLVWLVFFAGEKEKKYQDVLMKNYGK